MPPKKASTAPLPPPITQHFALTTSKKQRVAAPPAVVRPVTNRTPTRLLVDRDTEVAYAEVVNGVAVCLETGVDLFEVGRRGGDDDYGGASMGSRRALDFSPPQTLDPHPKWRDVRSQDLLDAGVLTENDFLQGKAGLTVAQYEAWMA